MRRLGAGLLVVSLTAVLLIDVARSFYARQGSAEPTVAWPARDASVGGIAWPPGVDLPENAPLGQAVYARRCAICHGANGRGDGPVAPALHPQPRDFGRGLFKFKSPKGTVPPRLDDVRRSIRNGIAGTSMPAWGDLLTHEEIDAVAEHVRQFGGIKQWSAAEEHPPVDEHIFAGASAERGKQGYIDLGCAVCHGEQARGDGSVADALRDVWQQPVAARDLTAPWTFRWGADRATVYRWIADGLSGTPMPGYLEAAEPQQIADVVVYLESLARVRPWQGGKLAEPPGGNDAVKRGEYLVTTGMCGLCHTPVDDAGVYRTATHYLAGGMKIAAGGHGVFFAANLTADEETGLGKRSIQEIAFALRTGHSHERRLNYWGMPWMVYGALLPEDALAIASYLKLLPSVRNSVPSPLYYGSLETVARKLLYPWPALPPRELIYAAGNFGDEVGDASSRTAPQTWLLRFQRAFVVLSIFAWFIGRPRPEDSLHRRGGVATAIALLFLFGAASLAFVDRYPALEPMPADPIVAGFVDSIPPAGSEGQTDPAVERGRYLFAVSSCAFCHGGDGSGGNKVSWRTFGSVWSANLTPHPTGLGSWSDDEIVRLLRSGVSRDGRQVHWQAMPWDSFSNYSEEDLRILLAFVRRLPAVERALPKAAAPQPGDCVNYTFGLRDSNDQPGCG